MEQIPESGINNSGAAHQHSKECKRTLLVLEGKAPGSVVSRSNNAPSVMKQPYTAIAEGFPKTSPPRENAVIRAGVLPAVKAEESANVTLAADLR